MLQKSGHPIGVGLGRGCEIEGTISPPIVGIQAIAAETPLGDLDGIWQAWMDGAAPRACPLCPADWQMCTDRVAQRITQSLPAQERRQTGLIFATTKGNIQEQVRWMRAADGAGEQSLPASSCTPVTLGSEAGRIGVSVNLHGPTYAVSTACSSGLIAIIDAALTVIGGEAPHMIALAADDASDFVQEGFRSLHALSRTSCKPFDVGRDGLMLGSAAAACLVSLVPNPSVLARISGWGVSNDATHMTAPDPAAGGLIRAIRQALAMAKLAAEQIDVLLAHGTATRYNDAMEAIAIERIFLTHGHKGPAVTAVKSLIGHTLGAAGLIEVALAIKILEQQIVPAIINLQHPENGRIDFVTSARKMKVRHLLKTASGFGGMNAAVILSAPETDSRSKGPA